ncbi:MAG: class IV adenylate cyclase [Flavobacteriales bacterium]|nr:class IV adenylate cyclase [Flavobacteriales bacterium]
MPVNVEGKFRLSNRKAIEEGLRGLSCERHTQTDYYVNYSGSKLKLREYEDGRCELIQYQRADVPTIKVSEYRIIPYASKDSFQAALKNFTKNYGLKGVVKKTRELYTVENVRIHVDQVEGLGDFLEIETEVQTQDEPMGYFKQTEDVLKALVAEDIGPAVAESYIDLTLQGHVPHQE